MHALPWEILFYKKNMQIVEKVTKKKKKYPTLNWIQQEGRQES